MQWNSIQEFLHMGGYALYVWGSLGTTAAAVALEIIQMRAQRRNVLRSLAMDRESESINP